MVPRRITCFGSSTIYGTADSELGGFVNRLRLWHESLDERNRVYNLGIWGEQTSALIERIAPEARARRSNLILIYPGFNDCRRIASPDGDNATTTDEFADLMRPLLSTAQAVAPTVVMTGFPFDEKRTRPYRETNIFYRIDDARQYTDALVNVAGPLNVKVLDFFGQFQGVDMSPLLASDGLHGNSRCHQRLFEMTREFLLNEYGEDG